MYPKQQTDGQNVYRIDIHWSDESSKKNQISIVNGTLEIDIVYIYISAFCRLTDEQNIYIWEESAQKKMNFVLYIGWENPVSHLTW